MKRNLLPVILFYVKRVDKKLHLDKKSVQGWYIRWANRKCYVRLKHCVKFLTPQPKYTYYNISLRAPVCICMYMQCCFLK